MPEGEKKASDLNYIGHLLDFAISHQPTRRLTLGLQDGFYLTRYPYYYDRLTTIIDTRKYWINRLSPYVFYDFQNRFSAGLRYNWNRIRYDKNDTEENPTDTYYGDSDGQELDLSLGYNPTRTTTLDFDYSYMWINYDQEGQSINDYKRQSLMLEGQKRYKYFAFDAGIGWQTSGYEHAVDDRRLDNFTYKLGVTGQSPPPSERRRHLGRLFLRPLDHFYLGWVRMANTYGDYYIADRFTLSLGTVFFDRINTQVRGWYQISNYEDVSGATAGGETDKRRDKTFDISGMVGYLFTDTFAVDLTGGRQDRDSNLPGHSYVNNYVILSIDFNYDVGARGGFVREALYYW